MIQNIKCLPMASFEVELWNAVGRLNILESERIKNLDWDSNKTHVYHCNVDPTGATTFKAPYLQSTKTHLQRVLGDDNVLVVKFEESKDAKNEPDNYCMYHNIAKHGISIGLRHYRFFVFKDGGKEEKKKTPSSSSVKCYFVRSNSGGSMDENNSYVLFNKNISEARSVFMHVHMVSSMAKYMARFSLILSKTVKLDIDLDSVEIKCVSDIPCMDDDGNVVCNKNGERKIHTDGTGFISEDLAMKCPKNIFKGECRIHDDFQLQRILDWSTFEVNTFGFMQPKYPPLLIQCRLFNKGLAVKGTLLVNKKLPPRTIHIRPSMIKVQPDPCISDVQCADSLEIVSTSNEPKKTFLSRNLIALLHYGGVPGDFFLGLLDDALDNLRNTQLRKREAMRVALNHWNIGGSLVGRMILCGIPLDEPYLQCKLSIIMKEEKKKLRSGKLPLTESFYLMGTTDPTGSLKSDEVCVILNNGQVVGNVLVYRNPGLHFGDIHVLKATYIPDLENFVGHSKYGIFFPTQGCRSIGDELAGGDFDGDMYWVSRNPQLLKYFKASKPWSCDSSDEKVPHLKPTELSDVELERQLFQQFLEKRFKPSYAVSLAADSWLSFMDRLLTLNADCGAEKDCLRQKMIQLVDIYYNALDAPKSGQKIEVPIHLRAEKFPHYMEKAGNFTYTSTSILGLIFDKVMNQNEDLLSKEVWKLPCLCMEFSSSSLEHWELNYTRYRSEMWEALKLDGELGKVAARKVVQKYKEILYGAPEFEQSARIKDDIFDEALAIYHIVYDRAKNINDVGKCSFAWEVAGSVLCYLHASKQECDSTMICLQSVLNELVA